LQVRPQLETEKLRPMVPKPVRVGAVVVDTRDVVVLVLGRLVKPSEFGDVDGAVVVLVRRPKIGVDQ
jgi:hypothetical protein